MSGKVPQFLKICSRLGFDVREVGKAHLPSGGPYVVCSNHVSYLDWLFLMAACCPRQLRFLIDENFTNFPLFSPFINLTDPIPVSVDTVKPKMIRDSLRSVQSALADGDIVGVFPEGGLTRNGQLRPFRRGLEWVITQAQVPVVPCGLVGLWGSPWSWSGGRVLFKNPFPLRRCVEVRFGEPIPPEQFSLNLLRERILRLVEAPEVN